MNEPPRREPDGLHADNAAAYRHDNAPFRLRFQCTAQYQTGRGRQDKID
ncbi:hypothetical protein MPEAHAMD_2714 [Methylobacterium frigidaeris]|uniref:Uncharacterized protein n=1 Tax=Methylobacterium frigidaeris TaxID=2038277 RepID=A0AA37M5D8_9HYPH|nr:hypothetical protein MPEAHAMD_2714 [Methylobacterium frigidaeris]